MTTEVTLDKVLLHPGRNDPFWNTKYGGEDTRNTVKDANIPILFTTGFYDIYTGDMTSTWSE